MVRPDGEPVILDFGLALDLDSDPADRLTVAGAIFGTVPYMAPEQAEGRIDDVDARTDVYALGAMLHELLTLRRPFEGTSLNALLPQIIRGGCPPPRRHNPAIPRDLEAVCLKALERDPDPTLRDRARPRGRSRATAARPPDTRAGR